MGASDKAGPPGQGHQDQVTGGDLPLLLAYQGTLLSAWSRTSMTKLLCSLLIMLPILDMNE